MVSRWAFDQFSNTVWTPQRHCLTGWRQCWAHQCPYTGCPHNFHTTEKQTHFWRSNLRHLHLARVPVDMLTHYTDPPPQDLILTKYICTYIHGGHAQECHAECHAQCHYIP